MSKERAFVRYTKAGKIVPGSLILTKGSYPSGPGLWAEVTTNLCCSAPANADTCIEIDITPNNSDPDREPDVIISSSAFDNTTSWISVDWGDGVIEGLIMSNYAVFNTSHKYEIVDQLYTIHVCFNNIQNVNYFEFKAISGYPTEIRDIKKLSAVENLKLDFQEFSSIDLAGMNSLTVIDLSNNSLLSNVNFGSGLPNLINIELNACAFTGNFDATIFPSLQSLYIQENNLTSINLSGLTNLTSINISDNPITSLNISGLVNLTNIGAFNCALTQPQVDAILIELDNNGLTNGSVVISGGTNATPSALGLAAGANLIGKGWAVNYNP